MDLKTRLTRRPVTTVLWIMLVSAMALFLSVGTALWYSSGSLARILDQYHTSIAVRTDKAVYAIEEENGVRREYENKTFNQNHIDLLENMNSVEGVYFHKLTGGYCPQLSPRISSGGLYMVDESYDGAFVIGTITRMTEPQYWDEYYNISRIGGGENVQPCSLRIEVKVKQLVAGNEDYTKWDAQWFDGYINVDVSGFIGDRLDMFQVGERYILYGDFDKEQIYLDDNMEASGHAWLRYRGESVVLGDMIYCLKAYSYKPDENETINVSDAMLTGPHLTKIDSTLEEFLAKPENADWGKLLEDQQIVQNCFPVLGTDALETMYVFVNNEASLVGGRFFTQEEYGTGERVCILNETVALNAGIEVGDMITLSQYLCHNFGNYDTNGSIDGYAIDGMLNNPTVGEFQPDTHFVTEDESFTVVGLYRLRNEWGDNSYAITPNTIFIPSGAQIEGGFGGLASSVEMERENLDGATESYTVSNEGATYGIYMTVRLKNGMVEEFENEIEGSSFDGQFRTLDQGFGKIQASLNELSASAIKLFVLVAVGWGLLLALYTLLYQGIQRQNIGIMRSLGASPKMARNYLFVSGMTVASIGIAIGTLLAGAIMDTVQSQLFLKTFGTEASMYSNAMLSQDAIDQMVMGSQLPVWVILFIGTTQLALFAMVLWIHAGRLSKCAPRDLLSK